MEDIGSRIAQRRKKLGLTQNQLAEKLYVSFQAVSSWERGKIIPDVDRIGAIAEALETTSSYLLDGVVPRHEEPAAERLFDDKKMYTFVKGYASAHNLIDTQRALAYARDCHEGQFRRGSGAVPFIVHPLNMACHAIALGIGEDSLLSAVLLHDVCELCGKTPEELPVCENVRETVRILSFRHTEGADLQAEKAAYFDALSENRDAVMTKLLARCNNTASVVYTYGNEQLRTHIAETRAVVLPLLRKAKKRWPEFNNALFLIKYQICTLVDSLESVLQR